MHALRSILASISANEEQSEGVRSLLSLLPQDEFGSYDCQIVSWGGVGSTELSNFLNRHRVTTNLLKDGDLLRHANKPPCDYGQGGPRLIVFLYGDPLTSVASHYRRGHQYHQALKTNGGRRILESQFPKSFEDYARKGEDLFGLDEFFTNWKTCKVTPPRNVLFLRYERMFEEEVCFPLFDMICEGREPGLIRLMVEEWSRGQRSRESSVPLELRQLMYRDLTDKVNELPPLLVRDGDGRDIKQFGSFAILN